MASTSGISSAPSASSRLQPLVFSQLQRQQQLSGAGGTPTTPGCNSVLAPSPQDAPTVKRNRPNGSRLCQQKLPAWQPILTAKSVIPTVFGIGALFIPIGIALLWASESVREWTTYYDQCNGHNCNMLLTLHEPFNGDVYFYYGLENYFQNHRRYMKSRSDRQLLGDLTTTSTKECSPYEYDNGKKIAPCGAIANSMFNDTFTLLYQSSSSGEQLQVPMIIGDLVWSVDKTIRFRNPDILPGQSLCDAFSSTVKPVNWQKRPCELDLKNSDNNGFLNADFIIWMRTAALPDFRKPYRALNRTAGSVFSGGLPQGNYTLVIANNYPVAAFSGKKSFIISTASWAGGKNNFLGIAYIVVGCICLLLGGVFLIIHYKFGHPLNETGNIIESRR